MDMADRKGSVFRRLLRSAERLSERAIARELSRENTPLSRSSASLVAVTRWDQRRFFFVDLIRIIFVLVIVMRREQCLLTVCDQYWNSVFRIRQTNIFFRYCVFGWPRS